MPAEDSSGPEQPPQFRSPKRTLARAFRLSRDRWKDKATQRREQLRALKVHLRDVEASRVLWKQKALYLQEQLDHLIGLSSSSLTEDSSTAQTPPAPLADPGSAPVNQAADPEPLGSATAATPTSPTRSTEPVKKKRRP